MRVFHARCNDCNWNTFDIEGFGESRTIRAQEFHSLTSGHNTELIIEDMKLHQEKCLSK
jgi:hypothetical protein